MSTIKAKGSAGASRALERLPSGMSQLKARVCNKPISKDARKAPSKEPMPHHDHDKHPRAHGPRHGRFGHKGAAPHHAGQACQRAAHAEHQHANCAHVMAQGLHHVRVGHGSLHDQARSGAMQ